MTQMRLSKLPPFQSWDCRACGRCCRGIYSVPVTEDERSAILARGWADDERCARQGLFTTWRNHSYLARNDDGACVFLSEQGMCRIHERLGESAKPLACRLYPFVLTPVGKHVHVGLRFDCPAVLDNHGRPLPEHVTGIKRFIPEVLPCARMCLPRPMFDRGRSVTPEQLMRITQAFDSLLSETSLGITRRLLACASVAHLLHVSIIDELQNRLEEFLAAATAVALKAAETDPLERVQPRKGVLVNFRQMAGLFNRWDRVEDATGTAINRLRVLRTRLRHSLILSRGKGGVPPLRTGFTEVPFSTIEEPFPIPTGPCEELLARYYRIKLAGMDFFGPPFHNYSYVNGMKSLLLTFPVIMWTARAFAIGAGDTEINSESLCLALQGVDAQLGRSLAFGLANERRRISVLSREEHLRPLTVWYGT